LKQACNLSDGRIGNSQRTGGVIHVPDGNIQARDL
jgi:hypothetical protein